MQEPRPTSSDEAAFCVHQGFGCRGTGLVPKMCRSFDLGQLTCQLTKQRLSRHRPDNCPHNHPTKPVFMMKLELHADSCPEYTLECCEARGQGSWSVVKRVVKDAGMQCICLFRRFQFLRIKVAHAVELHMLLLSVGVQKRPYLCVCLPNGLLTLCGVHATMPTRLSCIRRGLD